MRFQQLVFRTTPHSLVEWLDGELEKRGIDCVYTHCILSILQEDTDDTEPDECVDVRNNQQKVYHKYGGPESLYSATKSKHQKWKTYSKQILLTGSISSCDLGISDHERKNRNAAINCLKSVSEDNTIEDLIDEVCLKLKDIKNVNALENKDAVKSLNRVDKETAFYIPPSSPTDQVEKYFAAFPPLNNNFEERNCSDQLAHLNAWYNNCLRKNKNIVQDIFKNSQISSENTKNKIDNTYCSLKSIENFYQPENNNKSLNRLKIHNTPRQDNLKFSDENTFTEAAVKSNFDDISDSSITNMLSKFKKDSTGKKDDFILNIIRKNDVGEKLKNFLTNSNLKCDNKSEFNSKEKSALPLSSTLHQLCCSHCRIVPACITKMHNKPHKCSVKETSKPVITEKNSENVMKWEFSIPEKYSFTNEILSNPCKKFKSLENSDTSLKSSCESFELTQENIDIKLCEEKDDALVKKTLTSCPKSKRRKKSLSKDNSVLESQFDQFIFNKLEEQAENKRKDFEHSKVDEKDDFLISDKISETTVEPLKRKTNTKKRKNKSRLKKCSNPGEKNLEFLRPKCKNLNGNVIIKDGCLTEDLASKTGGNTSNDDCIPGMKEKASVKKVLFSTSDCIASEAKGYGEVLDNSQIIVANTDKTKQEVYFEKDISFDESNKIYFSGKNGNVRIKDVHATEDLSSKTDDECLPNTKEKAVKKVHFSTSYYTTSEDKGYGEILYDYQSTVATTHKTKQKIYVEKDFSYDESNETCFSWKNGGESAASKNVSNKKFYINKTAYPVDTENNTFDKNLKLLTCYEIPRCKLAFPFGNINLIKIGSDIYFNFNALKDLSFPSEHELFNIFTADDVNEISNFVRKCSTPRDRLFTIVKEKDSELKNDANNCFLTTQKTSKTYDNFDSRKCIEDLPSTKVSSSCSFPKIYCSKRSNAFSLKDLQLEKSDGAHSFANKFCEDITFENTNAQKHKSTNDNASVLFGNWEYNLFFDFYKGKADGNLDVSSRDHFSLTHPSFSDELPGKQICNDDTCCIDFSNNFYNDECNVSPYKTANTDDFVVAIKQVLYDFEEEYMSCLEENESKQTDSFSFITPKETIFEDSCDVENSCDVKNSCDVEICSAFKPASEVKQNCVPASSRNVGQNLLKKAVNIDRIIHKINGKNRVTSFENFQNISFTKQPSICEQIISHSPIGILSRVSNYSDKSIETENFIPSDSDWSKQFLMKKENFKSIWEPKVSSIGSIWGSPAKEMAKEDSILSPNKVDIDTIHQEFEKEQDELLRGLYSMPHLKEETDPRYSLEQNIADKIYDCPYELNSDPKNESLIVKSEEYTGISSVITIPTQATSKFSESNNTFDFPFSVPHVDHVGTFSLENCKSDAVDSQITCSDNYSNYIKSESYQESDFVDLSAFRGPYGSFSENKTNAIEGGGWSLDSDSYLLESEAFHDQSSSLQDLNTMGSENESFPYMQIDRQQFSSEDDEIAKINAARWPTGYMRRRMKHKYPPFKRPCAFYMEGHCNRSDCKFSHELSNITCRFWQEGSCFKGSTCPFLHGYAEDQKIVDQHRSFHKREPERNYSLDSEADFPSLSSSKSEKALVAKSEPVDIVRVKGLKNSRQTNH